MYTLLTDVSLTRRQRMCFVMDDQGDLVWSGKKIAQAISYLVEAEQPEFRLEGPDNGDVFHIMASRL